VASNPAALQFLLILMCAWATSLLTHICIEVVPLGNAPVLEMLWP
jgi:hypothetical protein